MQEHMNPNSPKRQLNLILNLAHSRRFILLAVVPFVCLLLAILIIIFNGRYVETENAYVKADKIPISSQVSGVVKELLVKENQTVHKGQLLYKLDPSPLQIALTKAKSKLAQVQLDILALKASYRAKEAEYALSQTKYDFLLRNQRRQTDLAAKNFTSAMKLDEAKENADIAALQVSAIEHDLRRLAESLGGGVNVPIEKHPAYLMAEAELAQAKLNFSYTEIKAPIDGVIHVLPKPGQYIHVGTISTTIVANNHPWLEANFTEKELTHVHPGQPVIATIDIYPGKKWKGVVESLSPATGSEFSIIPSQNATGNWVKVAQRIAVRIRLLPDPEINQLRAGLSSWVKIDTKYRQFPLQSQSK